VGERIEAGIGRASSHLRERADLYLRGLRDSTVQVQPDRALLDPLIVVGSARGSRKPGRTMVADGDSAIHTSSPGCERFRGDIAVFVIGALDGVERGRLISHLDACPQCDALRDELSETARALEVLRPVVRAQP
jgi:hypothetical protein